MLGARIDVIQKFDHIPAATARQKNVLLRIASLYLAILTLFSELWDINSELQEKSCEINF